METITLTDLFQPQLLAEAEATRVSAEQALRDIEAEMTAERSKMAARLESLRKEIPVMRNKLRPLQECILMKNRAGFDSSPEKAMLASTESKISEMEAEFKETSGKLPAHETRTRELIAEATLAFNKAAESEKKARAHIEKAVIAHEAYQSNPGIGVGPIPKFKTLKEAVAHFYKIGFLLTREGGVSQACVGDLVRTYVYNGQIDGMMPDSLKWMGRIEEFQAFPHYPYRAHILDAKLTDDFHFSLEIGKAADQRMPLTTDRKILCFIESSGQILASHPACRIVMPRKSGTEDFSGLFGSWEAAMAPFMEELRAISPLDLQTTEPLPMLGQLIAESWKASVAAVSQKSPFKSGQGRLEESQINNLVGAYWKAFIASPWEPRIEGTYALLKHRCSRGEIPNVYSCDTRGHFGFRVRTPDHDWIKGEFYCPPEHFSPSQAPDSTQVINHELAVDWLAELGPVKFIIHGKTSRT